MQGECPGTYTRETGACTHEQVYTHETGTSEGVHASNRCTYTHESTRHEGLSLGAWFLDISLTLLHLHDHKHSTPQY